jgi:putative membrane protein
MKKLILTAASAAVLIATQALAQAPTSQNKAGRDLGDAASAPVGMAAASTLGAVSTTAFVQNAARSDMYEIEASKLAETRSKNTEIKKFARQMVKDHTKTTAEVKAHLPSGVTPPAELDKRRSGMLDDLRASSASEFDKRYVDQQVAAHQEALTLMKGYAAHGSDAGLKQVAATAVPIVSGHLQMAKSIQASLKK